MEHVVSGLLGGIAGGIIVLVGFGILLKRAFRSNPDSLLSLSLEATEPYREIRILDHELRAGGIWVRCENHGERDASMPRFKLRVVEDNRLIAQHELWGDNLAVGQATEMVLTLRDQHDQPIDLDGRSYELDFVEATCHPPRN